MAVTLESRGPHSLVLRGLVPPPAGAAPGASTLSEFHFAWLRDNCPCAECLHPTNNQKLHNSFQVPDGIAPVAASLAGGALTLEWDRPLEPLHLTDAEYAAGGPPSKPVPGYRHVSVYPLAKLAEGAYLTTVAGPGAPGKLPAPGSAPSFTPKIWDVKALEKSPDLFMDFADVVPASLGAEPSFHEIDPARDRGLYRFLKQMSEYGIVILRNMPFEPVKGEFGQPVLAIERVAERIGPIMETFYGRTWDVKSLENSNNIAYTNVELGLHTDLCYLEKPPGLQFLHCLIQSDHGGENYFSDAYRAALRLKESSTLGESDASILSRIPVTFHYAAPTSTHRLRMSHPTITRTEDLLGNEAFEVTYSPPFQGPMEFRGADPQDVPKFYSAFRRFARLLEEPGAAFEYRLKPGEMVCFANRRVLHARKAFSSDGKKVEIAGRGEGGVARHLKGTYVSWDAFRDRLRGLSEVFEGKGSKL
ncbi:hypothetical protein DFJ74DRAFT_695927 [Hyaloraphidium curvatum]|nr:hypothetical protein DFJ74DRAFT_695927 [Hyaloraphidium curvatum]